jgi:hypothetical protein
MPINTAYWRCGFRLSVSSTVTDNVMLGYSIHTTDGVTKNDFGRIIGVDMVNGCVYMENNATNSYNLSSTVYVECIKEIIRNYIIGSPWTHEIGRSKIGGSHVPANLEICGEYINNSFLITKNLTAKIEYLY